jgi:hypothetical protein
LGWRTRQIQQGEYRCIIKRTRHTRVLELNFAKFAPYISKTTASKIKPATIEMISHVESASDFPDKQMRDPFDHAHPRIEFNCAGVSKCAENVGGFDGSIKSIEFDFFQWPFADNAFPLFSLRLGCTIPDISDVISYRITTSRLFCDAKGHQRLQRA